MDFQSAKRVLAALEREGVRYAVCGAGALNLLGDYPAVQYVPPQGTFHLDILTRLGEAFGFAHLETQRVPFDDLTVTVVTPRTLYRMKKGTVRLQDRADAEALRQHFGLKDE